MCRLKLNILWLILVICFFVFNAYAESNALIIDDNMTVPMSEWTYLKKTHQGMPTDKLKRLFIGVNLMAYAALKENVKCPVNKLGGWFVKKDLMRCYVSSIMRKIKLEDLNLEIESYAKAHWREYLKGKDAYSLSFDDKMMIRYKLLRFKQKEIEENILNELKNKYEVKFCLDGGC